MVNVGKYTIHGSYGNKPQNYNAATPSIAKVDRRLKIEGPSDAGKRLDVLRSDDAESNASNNIWVVQFIQRWKVWVVPTPLGSSGGKWHIWVIYESYMMATVNLDHTFCVRKLFWATHFKKKLLATWVTDDCEVQLVGRRYTYASQKAIIWRTLKVQEVIESHHSEGIKVYEIQIIRIKTRVQCITSWWFQPI